MKLRGLDYVAYMHDWKLTDKIAWVDIAGLEFDGLEIDGRNLSINV